MRKHTLVATMAVLLVCAMAVPSFAQPQFTTMIKLDGDATAIFSPDGKTIAIAYNDGGIKLLNIATAKKKTELTPDSTTNYDFSNIPITAYPQIAFGPDGETLASIQPNHAIVIYKVSTGKVVSTLKGHTGRVYSVAFHPDGKTLATCSEGTVRIWNMTTGKNTMTIKSGAFVVRFSPDGKALFSSGLKVTLWRVSNGKRIATFDTCYGRTLPLIEVSPDGKLLAVAEEDSTALWSVKDRKLVARLKRSAGKYAAPVMPMSFTPDGKSLATVASIEKYGIALWDIESRTLKTVIKLPSKFSYGPNFETITFNKDGSMLAAAVYQFTKDITGSTAYWLLWDMNSKATK